MGYATGQFGKNHLGDRDEHLPTNHGFDEFLGNLYHLNAEEEPKLPDYPDPEKYPDFAQKYGPREVIHSYAEGMVEHDMHVGKLLAVFDEPGIANNTNVQYGKDYGAHKNSWPDAAVSPFRGEKNTNWEGGWRTPSMIRWPDKFEAGIISSGIISGMDWFPPLLAAAGDPDIKEKLL